VTSASDKLAARPRLLDLFGAADAAALRYHRAGFEVMVHPCDSNGVFVSLRIPCHLPVIHPRQKAKPVISLRRAWKYIRLGRHYGYPPCCILRFALRRTHETPWARGDGSGYVRCGWFHRVGSYPSAYRDAWRDLTPCPTCRRPMEECDGCGSQ
jgi:hypothetical protein